MAERGGRMTKFTIGAEFYSTIEADSKKEAKQKFIENHDLEDLLHGYKSETRS